mmetsp:Transcript_51046/g.148180  ORF Transcript_51046/g.148180 Transcript_51046/m.148180 type:complete len:253 (+) Transcript_51046:350-1108(+)
MPRRTSCGPPRGRCWTNSMHGTRPSCCAASSSSPSAGRARCRAASKNASRRWRRRAAWASGARIAGKWAPSCGARQPHALAPRGGLARGRLQQEGGVDRGRKEVEGTDAEQLLAFLREPGAHDGRGHHLLHRRHQHQPGLPPGLRRVGALAAPRRPHAPALRPGLGQPLCRAQQPLLGEPAGAHPGYQRAAERFLQPRARHRGVRKVRPGHCGHQGHTRRPAGHAAPRRQARRHRDVLQHRELQGGIRGAHG